MKALRIWSIVMCVLVLLFVLMDIYGFFYALYPSYGDYPILPFGAKPYYARVLNDTGRYVMEPIIEADEYLDAATKSHMFNSMEETPNRMES